MSEERSQEGLPVDTVEVNFTAGKSIVLIDGVCHLCQGLVRFIIPRDPKGRFMFASLQSEIAQNLIHKHGIVLERGQLSTVVLLENGVYYTQSVAVLRIARRLRFPWSAAYGFIFVPPPLRNVLYRYVARNRYRWFGRDEQCLIPTPDIRRRFL
ncbi:thiol-disulfide oxidoreductase DCC family protein [Paenibacillus wynnii]|uniref:thiol-disulfide oxidoreductase DCC family protein n=1 Tax=Paenibacillus wynnii TaxID=268407 RepID=UPI0027905BF6|nr:DCC1-like thiol-disulfide oxidoreductase family protein [Paenibacillus wynnii]MDQ0195521.1 putative DCC family thiol-disulfide oxidoreductase YuxK [Paenibacillus wynnii]